MTSSRIKIGFLALCMDDFDAVLDVDDVRKDKLVNIQEPEYIKPMLSFIKMFGDLIFPGIIGDEKGASKANKVFREEQIDVIVIHEFTFTLAVTFIKALEDIEVPLIFWNTQENHTFSSNLDFGRVMLNNSISSIPHSTNVLYQTGRKFKVITGHESTQEAYERFKNDFKVISVKKFLKKCKIGTIGYSYPGMITITTNETSLRTKIGPSVEHINVFELKSSIKKIKKEELSRDIEHIKTKFCVNDLRKEEIEQSVLIYYCLRDILKRRGVHVLASLCGLLILEPELGLAPCYAQTRLIADGIQSACECDILTAVALVIVELLANNAWFSEFYMMDMEKNLILMSHCGYGNCSMANTKYEIKIVPQPCFPGPRGRGIAFEYSAKAGEITIVSFVEGPEGYKIVAAEAEAIDCKPYKTGCPQIIAKFKNLKLSDAVEKYCQAGGSHHMVVGYGNIISELQLLAEYLNIGFEKI